MYHKNFGGTVILTMSETTKLPSKAELEKLLQQASPEWVRELRWQLSARPEQIPPDDGWNTLVARMGRGSGKRLWTETPIKTPHGFKKMGELEVGDIVFDENGAQLS